MKKYIAEYSRDGDLIQSETFTAATSEDAWKFAQFFKRHHVSGRSITTVRLMH